LWALLFSFFIDSTLFLVYATQRGVEEHVSNELGLTDAWEVATLTCYFKTTSQQFFLNENITFAFIINAGFFSLNLIVKCEN